MTVHIKLYGSKADRFREIKEYLTEELGYEPSNPEVVGYMMGVVDAPDVEEGVPFMEGR